MNVLYLRNALKSPTKLYLTDENGVENVDSHLTLNAIPSGYTFEEVKDFFTNIDSIIIYSAIVQEDGRETDEIVHMYFDNFTKLTKLAYNIDSNSYTITLVEPNDLEERLTELEDAVNFMLMGGEE